jgi:hypothetical protein
MSLWAFLVAMAIAPLRMVPAMECLLGLDLAEATGMVAPTDTAAGEAVGMEVGLLGGDIPLIHTYMAHHLQCMCSQF